MRRWCTWSSYPRREITPYKWVHPNDVDRLFHHLPAGFLLIAQLIWRSWHIPGGRAAQARALRVPSPSASASNELWVGQVISGVAPATDVLVVGRHVSTGQQRGTYPQGYAEQARRLHSYL